MSAGSRTAILFFTRSEAQESKHKNFGTNRRVASTLSSTLISRTRKLLATLPFPVFEIGSDEGPVNERFVEAIESLWAKGFDRIISIGNDCPQLKASDLLAADEILNSTSLAVGPDHRGGVYLLGINRSAYRKDLFLSLPWHTNRFLDFLKGGFSEIGYLDPLSDINNLRDLLTTVNTVRKSLVRFLVELIIPVKSNFKYTEPSILVEVSLTSQRRGPPRT